MEENKFEQKKNIVSFPKINFMQRVASIAACVVIALGGGQIYATTQGYDNVFFMIKHFITGEDTVITGKDEILSDKDITISYETIKITPTIEMQVEKLQVKENNAKLTLKIRENDVKNGKLTNIGYVAKDEQGNELFSNKLNYNKKVKESEFPESDYAEYVEELNLKSFKEDTKIITLDVYVADSEPIVKLKIDLENKVIEIEGEKKALEKISEIKLKEFLGKTINLYKDGKIINDDETKIFFARTMYKDLDWLTIQHNGESKTAHRVSDVNAVLEAYTGQKIDNNSVVDDFFTRYTNNGVEYFVYNYGEGFETAECLGISDISYSAGLYTVTFRYCQFWDGMESSFDVNVGERTIYETKAILKLNTEEQYSKISEFSIVSVEKPIIIKNAQEPENDGDCENVGYVELTDALNEKDILYVTKAEKKDNNTYILYGIVFKCNGEVNPQYQLPYTWSMTSGYKKVTLSSDTICVLDEETTTVGKHFENYGEVQIEEVEVAVDDTTLNNQYTYSFEFENGKCVKVIDYCTSI